MMTPVRTYDIVNSYGSNFEAMLGPKIARYKLAARYCESLDLLG